MKSVVKSLISSGTGKSHTGDQQSDDDYFTLHDLVQGQYNLTV